MSKKHPKPYGKSWDKCCMALTKAQLRDEIKEKGLEEKTKRQLIAIFKVQEIAKHKKYPYL